MYSESTPIALRELFNLPRPEISKQRKLALTLTLAYSLLQLYEGSWLGSVWDKDHIQFYRDSYGVVDLGRPYIEAAFDQDACSASTSLDDPELHHLSPGLLSLGILLIEVHRWKPIEDFRQVTDLIDGEVTVNTDMLVVDACLHVPWAKARVSLEDQGARDCIYRTIIEPLQSEVNLIKQATGGRG
ncbi:hypothetical protein BJ508DRAFT_232369 [Ascobolus immersus RN42]|uniref:DUF7580 domain-containing protein n=1 Tax=Ascobolus immersus RN42 TaxID=1160509 RepID=A0A3N4HBX1_ASCIM|nr:hypothetical protein BJ508DRAFT_232369 [Ascobolus immersus RN42]